MPLFDDVHKTIDWTELLIKLPFATVDSLFNTFTQHGYHTAKYEIEAVLAGIPYHPGPPGGISSIGLKRPQSSYVASGITYPSMPPSYYPYPYQAQFQQFQHDDMKIPLGIIALQSMRRHDLERVLKAAILRLSEDEEESLIVSDADMLKADHYTLVTTTVPEDDALILSIRKK